MGGVAEPVDAGGPAVEELGDPALGGAGGGGEVDGVAEAHGE